MHRVLEPEPLQWEGVDDFPKELYSHNVVLQKGETSLIVAGRRMLVMPECPRMSEVVGIFDLAVDRFFRLIDGATDGASTSFVGSGPATLWLKS